MRWAVAGLHFSLCFCLPATQSAVAGAWLYPEGAGQVILTTLFAGARNAYGPDGRLVATPPYQKLETRAYLEHGVTDWLTFLAEGGGMRFRGAPILYDPLELLIAQAKAGLPYYLPAPARMDYQGLGLGAAGARLRLLKGDDWVLSIEGSLRAASREAQRFLDMRSVPQVDARLLMGRSFSFLGMDGFTDAQLGYRSGGQNGDEIRIDMTAGIRPFERITLMAQSFSAVAPRGRASRVTEQKFQLSAVFEATPAISVQFGGVAALGGVNAPAERGLMSAIWWRY